MYFTETKYYYEKCHLILYVCTLFSLKLALVLTFEYNTRLHVGLLILGDKPMSDAEQASIYVWLTIFISMQTIYMHLASMSVLRRFPGAM
jgi:hypothetical protein